VQAEEADTEYLPFREKGGMSNGRGAWQWWTGVCGGGWVVVVGWVGWGGGGGGVKGFDTGNNHPRRKRCSRSMPWRRSKPRTCPRHNAKGWQLNQTADTSKESAMHRLPLFRHCVCACACA
jgi:hypothetical protein